MANVQLTQTELQAILNYTVALAREAGLLILEGSAKIRSSGAADEKKNSVDLVTEYDVAVERLVKNRLSEKYPDFKFIGEESFAAGSRPELTDEPTFCVDPIDGTTNFIHGFPYACISLGLIYLKRPVLGVIYNPFLNQLYSAILGGGAYLEQASLPAIRLPLADPPRPLPSLSQALIGIEWGSDRSLEMVEKKGESFKRLAGDPATGVVKGKMAHSLRSLGSAALNYALVAQGGLDIYWEIGTWPWDICAGVIIAQEAGCFVAGGRDAPLDNDVNERVLWGRKHFVIRKIGDTETEKGVDAQKRLIKEFYETVEDFEPK
ncbi:hypothetical protein OH76DRAFT_813250 [Lentinus brumalis]|uniref:Inositol-1-monophosphatase n=1 Tax=Lentinus brumalis TaxID=2498619 RepID=A0A371D2F0_9APHY|nr:hypothetical protein OH76DRAFT_813250 [Polyporus brumalis]